MEIAYRLIGGISLGCVLFVVYMYTIERAQSTPSSRLQFLGKGLFGIGLFSLLLASIFGSISNQQGIFRSAILLLVIPFVIAMYEGFSMRRARGRKKRL